MAEVRFFGIRHHGPGCARSLVRAFAAWQPDAVLVEGPPEADGLLPHLNDAALVPPVALLVHAVETPQQAVFYPFARFSPEWQALRWAAGAGVAARFIDLPRAHWIAQQLRSVNGGPSITASHSPPRTKNFSRDSECSRPALS